MRVTCYLVGCIVGCSVSMLAQSSSVAHTLTPACENRISDIRKNSIDSPQREAAIRRSLLIRLNATCFAQLVAADDNFQQQVHDAYRAMEKTNYVNFIKTLESSRTDKQAGSSTGTGGTTNLVSKGLAAQTISLAAEYGALSESVNNQVVTVQGSLGSLGSALVRSGLFQYCPKNDPETQGVCVRERELSVLRRISYGVSFDTGISSQNVSGTASGPASGTSQPVNFTPSGHNLSGISVRFVLVNSRDDTSTTFKDRWEKAFKGSSDSSRALLDTAATNLLKSLRTVLNGFESASGNVYSDWLESSVLDLKTTPEEQLEEKWYAHASDFLNSVVLKLDPTIVQDVADLIQKTRNYRLEEDDFVSAIVNKPVVTIEYDENRPTAQIPTSTIRAIADKGFGENWSFTGNAAVAIYDSAPSSSIPGARRLRDIQAGLQLERKLPSLSFLGSPAVSAAYYYQYQSSPSILKVSPSSPLPGITLTGLSSNAMEVFATKGNISVAQLKLTLGTGTSSARIPISVSYSNRTELITKPTWRAQIGITYDFDSLFASSGAGAKSAVNQ